MTKLYLTFPGEAEAEYTHLLTDGFSYTQDGFGEALASVRNSLKLNLVYNNVLANRLINEAGVIKARFEIDGANLWTGVVLASDKLKIERGAVDLPLNIDDQNRLLDVPAPAVTVQNGWLCSTSQTSLSIIHQLLAGFPGLLNNAILPNLTNAANKKLDLYCPVTYWRSNPEKTVYENLKQVLADNGFYHLYNGNGELQIRCFAKSDLTPTMTIDDTNTINGSVTLAKQNATTEYDSVRVKYRKLNYFYNQEVGAIGQMDSYRFYDEYTDPANPNYFRRIQKTGGTAFNINLAKPAALEGDIVRFESPLVRFNLQNASYTMGSNGAFYSDLGWVGEYNLAYYARGGNPANITKSPIVGSRLPLLVNCNWGVEIPTNKIGQSQGWATLNSSSSFPWIRNLTVRATVVTSSWVSDPIELAGLKQKFKVIELVNCYSKANAETYARFYQAVALGASNSILTFDSYQDYPLDIVISYPSTVGGQTFVGVIAQKQYDHSTRKYSYGVILTQPVTVSEIIDDVVIPVQDSVQQFLENNFTPTGQLKQDIVANNMPDIPDTISEPGLYFGKNKFGYFNGTEWEAVISIDGDAKFKGVVEALSGLIGGWSITEDGIVSQNGAIRLNPVDGSYEANGQKVRLIETAEAVEAMVPNATQTPTKPVVTARGISRGVMLFWDRQANLLDLDHYEIQVGDSSTGPWCAAIDDGGTNYKGPADPAFAVAYEPMYWHQNVPHAGTEAEPVGRQLYYRVRAATKAGEYSAWSDVVTGATRLVGTDIEAGTVTADRIDAVSLSALVGAFSRDITVGPQAAQTYATEAEALTATRVYIDDDEMIFERATAAALDGTNGWWYVTSWLEQSRWTISGEISGGKAAVEYSNTWQDSTTFGSPTTITTGRVFMNTIINTGDDERLIVYNKTGSKLYFRFTIDGVWQTEYLLNIHASMDDTVAPKLILLRDKRIMLVYRSNVSGHEGLWELHMVNWTWDTTPVFVSNQGFSPSLTQLKDGSILMIYEGGGGFNLSSRLKVNGVWQSEQIIRSDMNPLFNHCVENADGSLTVVYKGPDTGAPRIIERSISGVWGIPTDLGTVEGYDYFILNIPGTTSQRLFYNKISDGSVKFRDKIDGVWGSEQNAITGPATYISMLFDTSGNIRMCYTTQTYLQVGTGDLVEVVNESFFGFSPGIAPPGLSTQLRSLGMGVTKRGKDAQGEYAELPDGLVLRPSEAAIPPGIMAPYAGGTIPGGWLLCNGAAVSRTTYAPLFAALGGTNTTVNKWGQGDGSTTFNLPDMVGAAPAGAGASLGYTQNETIVLGTKYNDQFQGFSVSGTTGTDSPDHTHGVGTVGGSGSPRNLPIRAGNPSSGSFQSGGASARHTHSFSGSPANNGNGVPRTGNVTRGKRVGVIFIIKY